MVAIACLRIWGAFDAGVVEGCRFFFRSQKQWCVGFVSLLVAMHTGTPASRACPPVSELCLGGDRAAIFGVLSSCHSVAYAGLPQQGRNATR